MTPLAPIVSASPVQPTTSAVSVVFAVNTEVIDELAPDPGDSAIYRHRYSGFFETELDEVLRGARIATLVLVGVTSSVCVESTVRDAMFRDYHCLLVEDCMAEPIGADQPNSNHDASLLVLQVLSGSITDSTSLHSALQALAPVSIRP